MIDYDFYFNLYDEIKPMYCEFEKWHFWDSYPIMGVTMGSLMPMNILVCGKRPTHLKKWQELKVTAILFGFNDDIEIYDSPNDYYGDTKKHMAAESIIPSGTFSPRGDKDFIQNETVIITGTITEVNEFEDEGDLCYRLKVKCDCYNFAVIIAKEQIKSGEPKVGGTIDGIFRVAGKVEYKKDGKYCSA